MEQWNVGFYYCCVPGISYSEHAEHECRRYCCCAAWHRQTYGRTRGWRNMVKQNTRDVPVCVLPFNPFRTAVPFWGQTILISSSLSPKRDWGPKGVCSFHVPLFFFSCLAFVFVFLLFSLFHRKCVLCLSYLPGGTAVAC